MTQTRAFDPLQFLCAWAADPKRVGAVAPSGSALADLITSEITAASGPILELGPGTGVFTDALLARGVREQDLTLVESGAEFASLLQARFPAARVVWMDASRLTHHRLFADGAVGGAVSGLPLLNMTPRKMMGMLSGVFRCLKPRGALYQFTYGPRCPVPRPILDRLGLKATRIGRTLRNVPPAAVYRITARSRSVAWVYGVK